MPLLFISHSSKDKTEAEQLVEWLKARNFESLFLDSDAHHGIKAGSDWEKALYQAMRRSHAFIFLLSDHWTASQWCGFEFMQARALGKVIFPICIQAGLDTQIASDLQHLDFSKDRDDALLRLQTQLTELSLNTSQHTTWDSSRSPYPGMMAFEAEDAPVFFGRDKEINQLRERLNQHRIQGSASVLTLLAASGAGKSSLIKAGLLPRLRHDKRNWSVTDAMRPEREPLRKLAGVLAIAADQIETTETLYEALQGKQAVEVLNETLQKIRLQKQQPESTLLLSIDQAEELFTTAKPEQTHQLLKLLAAAQAESLPILTLLTMRSEYLESLQNLLAQQENASAINSDLLTLETLPLERISQLIRGPAEVAGLTVEDGLLSAATQDAATTDALPLLAFALRELYEQFGGDGDLTLSEYQQLGSDKLNPLENAVQAKATLAIRPQQLSKAELKALRDAFIPHMVRVNDNGDYVRQPALWDDLPETAHLLLERLTNARLLVRRDDQVEVSHEALLRYWALLNGWLREEHDFLLGKQQLELSLHDWQQLSEEKRNKGLLRGIALDRAREWLFSDKAGLSADEKAFIRRSHLVEEKQRKGQRNRLLGFIATLIVVAGLAVWQAFSATKAEEMASESEKSAIEQQKRTELALNEANEVINYINFDLRDQLEPIVPLTTTSEIRTRVNEYYKNLGNIIKNEEFLWQRAVNLNQYADTLVAQGKLLEAEPLYREANQFMQQQTIRDPSNAIWQRNLSVSLISIGDFLSAQGKLDEAKAIFEKSLAITQTLANKDPSNTMWQDDLSGIYSRIGNILSAQDKPDEAKAFVEKGLKISQTLANKDPSNTSWQQGLSTNLESIGNNLSVQGKLDEAKAAFEKSLTIRQTLANKDPSNAGRQRDLSVSLTKIGDILSAQEKLDEAKAIFEKRLTISKKLANKDPFNARWQGEHLGAYSKMGNVLLSQGKLDEAKAVFKKSLKISQTLANKYPSNAEWQRELSVSLSKVGDILFLQDRLDEAKVVFEKSSNIAQTLPNKYPSYTEWQKSLSINLYNVGNILFVHDKLDEAKFFFEQSINIAQTLPTKDPLNTRLQRDLSVSLEKIGDTLSAQNRFDEAKVVFEKSQAIRQALANNDPSNAGWQADLVIYHAKLMFLSLELNDKEQARTHIKSALAILEPLEKAGLLNASQQGWPDDMRKRLKALE